MRVATTPENSDKNRDNNNCSNSSNSDTATPHPEAIDLYRHHSCGYFRFFLLVFVPLPPPHAARNTPFMLQLLALPASGEKIIFPLLTPMLHAYTPVVETLKGGVASRGGGELRDGEARGINCPVSIIYGSPDHDWMPHR